MALRGSATQVNTSPSATLSIAVSGIGGTGPQLNDIIVLAFSGGGGGGSAETVTFPTGFLPVTGLPAMYGAMTGITYAVAYKIGTGSEPSSYTVGASLTDYMTVDCWVFSGRSITAPFSAVAATSETAFPASPATLALTGLTAVAADDVLELAFLGYNPGFSGGSLVASLAAPAGYSNARTDFDPPTSFSQVLAGCTLINAAGGATGTNGGVVTYSGAGGSPLVSYAGFELSVAVAPAASSYTLLANAGVYNLNGGFASSDYTTYAVAGAYAMAGEPVLFNAIQAFILTAAFGAYTITGEAATLGAGPFVLPAATGFYAITSTGASMVATGIPKKVLRSSRRMLFGVLGRHGRRTIG